MENKIIVDKNLEVSIRELIQTFIYDGLLEGIPTESMNINIMRRNVEDAKEYLHLNEIYLIEPTQTPIENADDYPFGKPARIPSVVCIAKVKCYTTFKDLTKHYSELGLVWYQNSFAFPIDEKILDQMLTIPFRDLCKEFEI